MDMTSYYKANLDAEAVYETVIWMTYHRHFQEHQNFLKLRQLHLYPYLFALLFWKLKYTWVSLLVLPSPHTER
jgi:hypothetical protein